MIKEQRLEEIRRIVDEENFVTNEELMKKLNVSRTTIYRDLCYLDQVGDVQFVRGGVSRVPKPKATELPFHAKKELFLEEKRRIARFITDEIEEGDSVFLDSGSTTGEIAKLLAESDISCHVITNDLICALTISSNPNIQLTVIGGDVRNEHYSMNGLFAESMISQLSVDKAVIGVDSVKAGQGILGFHSGEIAIKKWMLKNARMRIIATDHSKFELDALIFIDDFSHIDQIVTGRELTNRELIQKIAEAGADVCLV